VEISDEESANEAKDEEESADATAALFDPNCLQDGVFDCYSRWFHYGLPRVGRPSIRERNDVLNVNRCNDVDPTILRKCMFFIFVHTEPRIA
jgi:hypothetical protein